MASTYIHNPLNEEITAIGGHYVITKEIRLPVDDREILYTVGFGVMDTTCCGTGGCAYVTVHGVILEWKESQTEDGIDVTQVQPVRDEGLRRRLKEIIGQKETVQQVNFL